MLVKLDFCQVRDMYYIYLLWLSLHCGWFVWEHPSMYQAQNKMMCILC